MGKLTEQNLPKIEIKTPEVSFKYLYNMKRCLSYVHKESNKKTTDYFDKIQEFINKYSMFDNINAANDYFCPRKGKKISSSGNKYIRELLKELKSNYPEVDGKFVDDELDHYHLKPGGKGAEVVFGFTYSNVLYVVDFDLYHDFNN